MGSASSRSRRRPPFWKSSRLPGNLAEPGQSEEALNIAIAGAELMFPQSSDAILRSPTGWTDDMFMASSLLSRIGAQTGDARYGATVGRLLTSYSESLQRSDGLFVHSQRGPHAWGRGNGFAILGLSETLASLPDVWADRARVRDIYRRNGDQVVDFVNVRIVLPATPGEAHVTAAANLAARLGYETSAMNLGLTQTGASGSNPFDVPVILIGEGAGEDGVGAATGGGVDDSLGDRTARLAPGQGAISWVPESERFARGGIRITGYDATGLLAAADYAAGRYPQRLGARGGQLQ